MVGVAGAGAGGMAMGKLVSSACGTTLRPLVAGTAAGLGAGVCGEASGVEGGCPGVAGAAKGEAAFCRPASNALVVRV